MKKWEKISEEIIHKNPWWMYKHDKYMLPDGKEGDYYYMDISPAAIIIPVMEEGKEIKIVMIRQYRYLTQSYSMEFPMGGEKESQTIEECARAELEEETGYRTNQLEFVCKFFPYEGLSKDVSNVFIARDLVKSETNLDETEEIEVLIKTPREIEEIMKNGEITNGAMIAAWVLARNKIINN